MKFENTKAFNFEGAFRGMRNPYKSQGISDSALVTEDGESRYELGAKDIALAQKLIRAGTEHRKFLRQIFVCVDITAPRYWWTEFDTYKVGTVANSESTMHTLEREKLTKSLFVQEVSEKTISDLEILRIDCLAKKEGAWRKLIANLPQGFLQKRTITMNYENILSICRQRKGHKLSEWAEFIEWAKTLPYAKEFLFLEGKK